MDIKNELKYVKIYKSCYTNIFRYCTLRVDYDSDAAEEITQDVFLFLAEKWNGLEEFPDMRYDVWLYKVAQMKVYEYYRQKKKLRRTLSIEDCHEIHDLIYNDDLNREFVFKFDNEIELHVDEILSSLSESEKELYNYIYVEKKKYADISDITGKSESAVKMKAKRLNDKIKDMVKKLVDGIVTFCLLIFM